MEFLVVDSPWTILYALYLTIRLRAQNFYRVIVDEDAAPELTIITQNNGEQII